MDRHLDHPAAGLLLADQVELLLRCRLGEEVVGELARQAFDVSGKPIS
jgi:hypothetical protein